MYFSEDSRLEDYFVLVLVFSKDFQLQPELSQAQTDADQEKSSLPSAELEDWYPSCDMLKFILRFINKVKAVNSGHLRVLKYLSVIERCPLLGVNLKKIVIFGTLRFVCYLWHVRYFGCPLLGGFTLY